MVLAGVGTALLQQDIDLIVSDFLHGFNKFMALVELKLDFTQALPFAICGLATSNPDVAKQHGKALVDLYDRQPSPDLHDRVTVAWLDPKHDNGLRHDLLRWCNSEQRLDNFPTLELEVASLRFVPLVEWDAERPHSILKRAVMGKASKGIRASLAVRMKEIRQALKDPTARARFVDVFNNHSDIFDVIAELGLSDHEVLTQELVSWL